MKAEVYLWVHRIVPARARCSINICLQKKKALPASCFKLEKHPNFVSHVFTHFLFLPWRFSPNKADLPCCTSRGLCSALQHPLKKIAMRSKFNYIKSCTSLGVHYTYLTYVVICMVANYILCNIIKLLFYFPFLYF